MDPRNLQHSELQWRFCTKHYCTYYEQLRRYGGHSPYHTTCHKHWVNCEKDACEIHLWDKRQHTAFPGHTHDWHKHLMFLQQGNNHNCYINNWQYCLKSGCDKHQQDKFMNRFLRTDGNGWTYCPVSGKTLQSGKD